MFRALILFCGFFSCFVTFAEDFDCTDSGSTICEAKRLEHEYKCADKDLNILYKAEMNALKSPEKKKKLIEVQRAWIKFRNNLCEYENFEDGAQGINLVRCLDRVTIQRVNNFTDPNIDKEPWTCKE